ncbi:methionyl-tRNA formyltransferase [Kaistia dalseonensis]|uniref:Methionyl-tRNA formyltransferase n=1 Tax=Kaistia dalseonensis TaxID=410840 RepID=A0ABU0H9I3_9HYPH|nr:methionyl-tRNA formyltransferase [Kaistia dalseonensis]MCX5496341.1 methionyl-tRNA formyltransferase [Kaistia dalseonensis]MDQ0438961.1 hypothetical protein [Kaistia dalseonensis]
MALIRSFEPKSMDRNSVHHEISATYTIFERDDRVFVQLDSYGTKDREMPGKKSQTIQLDEAGARQLVSILTSAFRF